MKSCIFTACFIKKIFYIYRKLFYNNYKEIYFLEPIIDSNIQKFLFVYLQIMGEIGCCINSCKNEVNNCIFTASSFTAYRILKIACSDICCDSFSKANFQSSFKSSSSNLPNSSSSSSERNEFQYKLKSES